MRFGNRKTSPVATILLRRRRLLRARRGGGGEGGAATSVVVERMRQLVSCINTAMTFSSETGRARRGRPILSRVMRESLVFVEVKTRSDCEKGFPAEAVTPDKRDRYERIALSYLKHCDIVDVPVRFDVVSIVVVSSDRALIRHHINAFSAA